MRCSWLTDIHLNFLKPLALKGFYDRVKAERPDALLISGDIAESDTVVRDDDSDGNVDLSGAPSGKSDDDMYDKAVYIVTTTRNASISWVQRQLRIGYNRAARLVEEMEKQGIVSPPDHTNKREVLVAAA